MDHSCESRNPGNRDFFYFLDCRFRGNDKKRPSPGQPTVGRPLDGQGRGENAGFLLAQE